MPPLHPPVLAVALPLTALLPRCWSRTRKWTTTDVLSATGFNRIMVSTIMAPALHLIAADLNMSSMEAVMAMSAYVLAGAFGPLVIGPLSEVYGRRPVLHISNLWFLGWNLVCGFANSKGLLIAARTLAGLGASAIYALAGGVLGDLWAPEQRGRSLGMYQLIPLLGAAVGPIIGGFMAGRTTWRWMFWSTSAFQAVMMLVAWPTFGECYAPLIIRRRAAKLRKDTGEGAYYTLTQRLDGTQSPVAVVRRSLSRPLRMLLFHPIIQLTALISGLGYGVLYILLSTFSEMWITQYHQTVEVSGLHYVALALGEMLGSQVAGFLMDRIFRHLKSRADHREIKPEYHLPLMLPSSLIGAAGLLMYGWTVHHHVHWAVIDLSLVVALFGFQMSGAPIQAYVIDSYPEHASSATAAMQLLRGLAAFGFPLFSPKMYEVLGYGWGNSMLALVMLIKIPAMLMLWSWGPGLRAKAGESH